MPIQTKGTPPFYKSGKFAKKFTAILSQSGTNAPVATVLNNTIGFDDINWTRTGAGSYRGTLVGEFPLNKTVILVGTSYNPDHIIIANVEVSDDYIAIRTFDNGVATDSILTDTGIDITIYQ